MKEYFLRRQDELGMKRTELVRKFIVDDMEKRKELEKPQIVYYQTETTLPSNKPLPTVVTSRRPIEMAGMMSANAEVKRIIEQTGGNPRRALKKVIRE